MRRLTFLLHSRFSLFFYILLFAIILFIGTIVFWFVNILASIGTTVILIVDFFAQVFTVIGINHPAFCWLVLGCLLGGTIGLIQGLKRTGYYKDIYKVYLAATILFLLLQAVAYAQWQSHFDISDFDKVVIQETFTSPQDWRLSEGATIKNGGLFHLQPKVNDSGWSIWEGQTFSDVDFSADVVKVNGPDNVFFGILARFSSGTNPNFYYLRIDGNGNFAMGKYSQNQWQDLVGTKATDMLNLGNSKNHLRLVCQGNIITGVINDKIVGRFRDTLYRSGKIAVQSARGEENAVAVYFDNVLIKAKLD